MIVEWNTEMDGRIRRHSAAGMNSSAISEATGIPPRSITRRLAVLREGAKADTRRKAEDPYGLRTPAARKAEAAIESWMIEAARDDTIEWRAWDLVHLRRVPAKVAARRLGIPLAELWETLVREKAVLASRSLA